MAVARWIWGNANSQDPSIQEYQIRLCDEKMKPYRGTMTMISNRLVSAMNRYGDLTTKRCWFAGKIAPDMYVVALGGEQNSILGTQYAGTRGLFGVMAFGFTGKDICLYQQTEELFFPLKQLLCQVNDMGKCDQGVAANLSEYCQSYVRENPQRVFSGNGYNIFPSNLQRDATLWENSLMHPVMTGILTAQDAKRLLNTFHDGMVTVCENVSLTYVPREDASAVRNRMKQSAGNADTANIPGTEKKKELVQVSTKNTGVPSEQTKIRLNDIAWPRVIGVLLVGGTVIYAILKFFERLR